MLAIAHEGDEGRARVRRRALGGHRRAVNGGELDRRRQRAGEAQARIEHLAFRIKADLGLPARHQFDAAAQRRAMDDLAFHRLGDAERLDQLAHVRAARRFAGRGMRDGAGGKHRLLDLVGRRQIGLRRAGAHHGIDAHQAEHGAALRAHDAVFLVAVEDIGRHHQNIGRLAGRDLLAQRRHHREHEFDLVAGLPLELRRQLLEDVLRRAAAEDAQRGHDKS